MIMMDVNKKVKRGRFLSILLSVCMVLSILPASSLISVNASASTCTTHKYVNGICTNEGCNENEPAVLNNGVYEISNAGQLLWFSNHVNVEKDLTAKGKLMSDIDMNPGYTFEFMPDTGLVAVTKNNENPVYLGTGVKGNSAGSDTKFDTTASVKNTVYKKDSGSFSVDSEKEISTVGLREWTSIGPSGTQSYNAVFDGNGKTVSGLFVSKTGGSSFGLFGTISKTAVLKNIGVTNSYINGVTHTGTVCGWNKGCI